MELQRILEKRGAAFKAMRDLVDAAGNEGRAMTAEENQQYEKWEQEFDGLSSLKEKAERSAVIAQEMAEYRTQAAENPVPGEQRMDLATVSRDQVRDISCRYVENRAALKPAEVRFLEDARAAFGRYLRTGLPGLSQAELRVMQADLGAQGGALIPPINVVMDLIKAVDNDCFFRQLASVTQLTEAASLGKPTLDTDMDDATWTSELATGSEDTALRFGMREMTPHPLAKRTKISAKLLRIAALSPETLVRQRLAYKFAVTQEKAFMTGSGAQQPLGVFTASAQGINTDRDVSTGNSTTAIGADNLIECKYTLKGAYHPGASWIFHRDAVKMIRKLKDGNGQYLWLPGIQAGQPDRILDLPFRMSEYAPNTFTTGLYVGMLADWKRCYQIVDALDMTIQRLVELYAEANEVGFIARQETDGMPVLSEAAVRVKLA